MRVPLSLLRSFCDPDLSTDEIASVLALSGTEVERITELGVGGVENFVIGKVVELVAHPDADRLRVCTVDVGDGTNRTIVCGAANVAEGQFVAVALPGAVVANGMKIKLSKLRGVKSEGMICSEEELGLGSSSDGILELDPTEGPAGRPLGEVLTLQETVLELEITPNRPDCLGVWGVARELHAATGAALSAAPWDDDLGSVGSLDGLVVDLDAGSGCSRFTARIYEGIDPTVPTPRAIKAHLIAAGMRSVSAVVDITNYAMLVTGEPMHAFDLDRIAGGTLKVRGSNLGEVVEALDGTSYELNDSDVVIADADGPTSIAGVMGGARSEVSDATTHVALEAAVWNGPGIHATSVRLGLRSEASTRFEKGLAPVMAGRAQAFASKLFELIFSCAPNPGTIDIAQGEVDSEPIQLDPAKASSLLGIEVEASSAATTLSRLGCVVEQAGPLLHVVPPPERLDLGRAVDLVEEIARIDGLDRIPSTLPPSATGAASLSDAQRIRRRIEDTLAGLGLFEIAGWSFDSPRIADRLLLTESDPRRSAVVIENPMSAEESLLRTTLLGSLLDAAAHNSSHGIKRLGFFEIGSVYIPASSQSAATEPQRIAGLLSGPSRLPTWRDSEPPSADVHSGVGVLAGLLDTLRVDWSVIASESPEPFLHPGRAAEVLVNGLTAGWIGDLHPQISDSVGVESACVFELDLAKIAEAVPAIQHYQAVSGQPAVLQDLAVIVPRAVSSGEVVRIALESGGEVLESVELFDVYASPELGEDVVSIALRLTFRAEDRTLTEEDASAARALIVNQLNLELGATARV